MPWGRGHRTTHRYRGRVLMLVLGVVLVIVSSLYLSPMTTTGADVQHHGFTGEHRGHRVA